MALSTNDEAIIREYLLGHLSDEEQLKIEERLMTEADLFQELEISKNELIEDYCSGDLSQKEREWFEQHFLASTEGKQKYTFAIALDCLERPNPQRRPMPAPSPGRLSTVPPWMTAVVSLVVVAAIAIAIIRSQSNHTPTFVSFELPIHSLERGQGSPPPTIGVAGVDEFRVSLVLPSTAPAANSYHAQLLESNNPDESTDLQVVNHDSRKVSIVIPTKELPPGEYAVRLLAVKPDGTEQHITGHYFFNVE